MHWLTTLSKFTEWTDPKMPIALRSTILRLFPKLCGSSKRMLGRAAEILGKLFNEPSVEIRVAITATMADFCLQSSKNSIIVDSLIGPLQGYLQHSQHQETPPLLREFYDAQGYFDEALHINVSSKHASDFVVSNILLHQGQIHYNLFNQNDLAIDCFQRSLEHRDKANVKDDVLLAETWVSIGRSLEFRGLDLENAIDCYNCAMSLYSLQLNDEEIKKEIARTIHLIGTAKFRLRQYDDAFLQLKEALHRKISCFGEDHAEISLTLHYLMFSKGTQNPRRRSGPQPSLPRLNIAQFRRCRN